MSQQGTGTINENDLMRKLVNAKKVMNAVDGGTFTTGNVNTSVLLESPDVVMQNTSPSTPKNVKSSVVNEDKIRGSKLPDSIKEAMIKNPIPTMEQITLSDSLDMNFIEGAKKLMEREGLSKKPQQTSQYVPNNPQVQQATSLNEDIKSLIRETIKDTLEEIVDKKLNLILTAQQTSSINENLVLKVGDSIFKGKITGVNKSK
jgi:hypothetical protein